MSRIGKKPIEVPKEVTITVANNVITVQGPKGKLDYAYDGRFTVKHADGKITVVRPSDQKKDMAAHGLIRSLINNMVIGVTKGYTKQLELSGVGFRAQVQGKVLTVVLSYTHPINYQIPDGITIETPKPNVVIITGIDKAKVGEAAAEIRFFYEPEPYKGKGFRYSDEIIRRKAGKAVAGAAGAAGGGK